MDRTKLHLLRDIGAGRSHHLPRTVVAAAAVFGVAVAGCATSVAKTQPTAIARATASADVASVAARPSPAARLIDERTAIAEQTYDREVGGAVVHERLHQLATDPGLHQAASTSVSAMRAYVNEKFMPVWYHQHVSRLQILRGEHVVVDAGVPFVVDGPHTSLPGGYTLRISIQDEIGFVRVMARNHPVQVVVHGQGAAHVRGSLPAATHASLPSTGSVTLAGVHYDVRSFSRKALGGERVKIWILDRA